MYWGSNNLGLDLFQDPAAILGPLGGNGWSGGAELKSSMEVIKIFKWSI